MDRPPDPWHSGSNPLKVICSNKPGSGDLNIVISGITSTLTSFLGSGTPVAQEHELPGKKLGWSWGPTLSASLCHMTSCPCVLDTSAASPPCCGVSEGLVQVSCAPTQGSASLPAPLSPHLPSRLDAFFLGQGHGTRLSPWDQQGLVYISCSATAKEKKGGGAPFQYVCHEVQGSLYRGKAEADSSGGGGGCRADLPLLQTGVL